MFLVVLQGALGDDLRIISRVVSCYLRNFCFVFDTFCSLSPCRTVGMSNIVHAFVLSSTGIDVRVASTRFHSFAEADTGHCFLPTAWTI